MSRAIRSVVLLAALAGIGLAGCQTVRRVEPPPPVVEPAPVAAKPDPPKIVFLPRPAPPPAEPKACVPKSLGPAPRYPDSDAALRASPGAADRYQLLAAGRILRQQRLEDLERVVAGCR